METIFIIMIISVASWFWETYSNIVKSAPSKWVTEDEYARMDARDDDVNFVYSESPMYAKIIATLVNMGGRAIGVLAICVAVAIPVAILIVLASYIFGF